MLHPRSVKYLLVLLVAVVSLSCHQTYQSQVYPTTVYNDSLKVSTPSPAPGTAEVVPQPLIRQAGDQSILSPTPDSSRKLPGFRTEEERYTVQRGDTLNIIARKYEINVQMILKANQLENPDLLEVGQELIIPAPIPGEPGSGFKILPDSELVYGPLAHSFDMGGFLAKYDSYLGSYTEEVEGVTRTGPEIVLRVAQDYSVNPRLLLAVLEYQSRWITQANPDQAVRDYPMGNKDSWRKGLYLQMAWAANNLNKGYYLWKVNALGGWLLEDGILIPMDATINAGTAGVQHFFAQLYKREEWDQAVSPQGLFSTFSNFFGHPFDYAVEPLVPPDLELPSMQLPFEPEVNWAFTGGPHGGWGDGSAWAGLDFAPGAQGLGCIQSDFWVVAVTDGLIIRADQGRVIQDLDGDGNEGSGWVVLYMHIESRDRVQPGTMIKAGERIGHPSCEGGYSTGTHFHLARRYNGEWIPADQGQPGLELPFNLDGWISSGDGIEYDGYLTRDGESIEAWEGYFPENTIHR